jgi:hypothetical protein
VRGGRGRKINGKRVGIPTTGRTGFVSAAAVGSLMEAPSFTVLPDTVLKKKLNTIIIHELINDCNINK